MSDQQIQQILKRLDAQDKASEERLNAQYEVYKSLQAANRQHQQNLEDFKRELEPLLDAFKNVEGFGKVTIATLKFLAILGTGIGVAVSFVLWLKAK